MRPPEAAAVALKKLLTQPKAQEGWWGPLLAGEQPCLGWGFVSPGIPTGAWCPHADSPVQPAPRCRCHSPFSREMQTTIRQMCTSARRVCVLGSALPCRLGAVHGTKERREQGLASAAAPLHFGQGLLLGTGTPAWHHSALGQHQTLDAFARHQRIGSESLAKGIIASLAYK